MLGPGTNRGKAGCQGIASQIARFARLRVETVYDTPGQCLCIHSSNSLLDEQPSFGICAPVTVQSV